MRIVVDGVGARAIVSFLFHWEVWLGLHGPSSCDVIRDFQPKWNAAWPTSKFASAVLRGNNVCCLRTDSSPRWSAVEKAKHEDSLSLD